MTSASAVKIRLRRIISGMASILQKVSVRKKRSRVRTLTTTKAFSILTTAYLGYAT